MAIAFLTPLFALGLAALAIPLLVHLVHKERKESMAFPSLMFLQRTQYQHSRRQRIRDWFLFLLRAGALLLLVAAFARPVLRLAPQATGGDAGRQMVVMLDRSYSMSLGRRWEQAREAARAAIDRLGASDRGALILFDDVAQVASDPSADKATLRAIVDSVRPVPAGTRLAPAVSLARNVLESSQFWQKEVVVITDMQRSAWDLAEDARFAPGTEVTVIDVGSDSVADMAVRSVEWSRDPAGVPDRAVVRARVANSGAAVAGVEVRLEVGGRIVGTSRVNVPAGGGAVATFSGVVLSEFPQPAAIRLESGGSSLDDVHYFVLGRRPRIRTLLVEGGVPGGTRELFLRRALELVDDPALDVRWVRATQLGVADLRGQQLIVWNDAPYPPGELGRRVADVVRDGAGFLLILGDDVAPGTWPTTAGSLLTSAIGQPVDRLEEKGTSIAVLDRSHPALSLFAALGSGDLAAPKVFRYRTLAADSGVVMRYRDGAPALVERRFGRGRVLIWTSAFDGYWNEFPRYPVFLPLVHQLSLYASAYNPRRASYEVGEAVDLVTAAAGTLDSASGAALSVRLPSGKRLRVDGDSGAPSLVLREAGIYEVRPAGSPGARPSLLAANIPARELEFTRFDPLRLTDALLPLPGEVVASGASGSLELEVQERRQSLWWYLLVIAGMLLLGEALLAGRLAAVRRTTV
ncbi:MAG TPA: VWA domain-containing protein [Gemmatimonadaceae bacterium]|nr:VWA domain-containing protein [Gemmatimonadaceae bacterium]